MYLEFVNLCRAYVHEFDCFCEGIEPAPFL
jgi:hypothetical protein